MFFFFLSILVIHAVYIHKLMFSSILTEHWVKKKKKRKKTIFCINQHNLPKQNLTIIIIIIEKLKPGNLEKWAAAAPSWATEFLRKKIRDDSDCSRKGGGGSDFVKTLRLQRAAAAAETALGGTAWGVRRGAVAGLEREIEFRGEKITLKNSFLVYSFLTI